MSFEQLKNIIDWNKENEANHPKDEDLENKMCTYDAWPLNDHIAEFMKRDNEFIEGIKRGAKDCKEGKTQSWSEIKKELQTAQRPP